MLIWVLFDGMVDLLASVELIPEDQFAAQFSGPISLIVKVPADASAAGVSWGLNGQTLRLDISVTATVKELKEALAALLKGGGAAEPMPVNEQQLKVASAGFLKDANSLASYNVGNNCTVELSSRSRGGKR